MLRRIAPAEGLLTLIGICLMLWTVLDSVMQAAWVEHLGILAWIALIAFLYGIIAAKSRLVPALAHAGALALGASVVLWLVSRTIVVGYDTKERLGHLWQRFYAWFEITVSGGTGTDNLLFLLFLGGLAWAIVYASVWAIYREHGIWVPVLSTGAGLIVNLSYARDLSWYIIPYLAGAFLLVVRLNIFRQEQAWKRANVDYENEFGWDFLSTGIVASAVIIALVWFAPRAYAAEQMVDQFSSVSRPWRDVENEFNRLFGGLAARYEGGISRPVGISGISRVMALRGSTNLGPTEIMYIDAPRRSYWRGVVYDRYTGTGWMMGESLSFEMPKGDARLGSGIEPNARVPMTYTVVILEPRGEAVVSAPEPRRFSIPVKAELSRVPTNFQAWNGEGESPTALDEPVEVAMIRSENVAHRGSYSAVSLVSNADEAALRQAGTEYPAWIKDRYLQLPRIPKEVGELAHRLTADATNPYEKARLLESHLRTSYTYSETVSPPTGGEDAVAHFLFTGKTGYCDYFASALTVMLRTQGIPARVVAGYASGNLDENSGVWIIRDSDSHAWVEAYFPGYGWIEFEPTPIRSIPLRQDSGEAFIGGDMGYFDDLWMDDLGWGDVPEMDSAYLEASEATFNVPAAIAYSFLALLTAFLLGIVMLMIFWRRGLEGLSSGEAMYARMGRLAGWMGVKQAAHQTPAEYAGTLVEMVPEVSEGASEIARAYVYERFGRKTTEPLVGKSLARAWESVRTGMLSAFLRGPGLQRNHARRRDRS